ncbi:hypothetical protein BC828DRAFT_374799 [Blastocladiella britannica]|nr:hypothetical protein BC828DRAFT_374799 [Blastocladiella britannica]
MAPSVASSTNSAAANGKPSALAMRRQSFKSIAAATIAANKLVESVAPPHWLASVASQIADGIGPGVPVAVASAKRYDGASLAARDLPAPRVPRLSADPRIARCVTLVKAVESDRNALLQQLARADAELDRLTDETDPELLNDLVTEIALVQQQIDATNARLAQNSSHIRDRHAQSLQQTEAQTNEQIQSVNQRATENQIKRMTPLNRAIVDKHARIMREVMSVRAQESALLAELMAAESRLSEIKRQLRHWTDKCDLLPDTLTGTTAPSLLSLPGPQNQRSGSPSLGAAGLVVRAKTLASSSSSRPTTTATTDSNCGRHRSWDNNNEPPIHVPERLPPLSDRYFVGRPPPPPLPLPVQSTTENKAE